MNKSTLLNVYNLLASPIVLRFALLALGVVLASLAGPAAAQACSGGAGGTCGG
jgi:hypothetical protein